MKDAKPVDTGKLLQHLIGIELHPEGTVTYLMAVDAVVKAMPKVIRELEELRIENRSLKFVGVGTSRERLPGKKQQTRKGKKA
jgi:hypothetical protein